MHILAAAEDLLEHVLAGDVGEHPQLDLGVVGGDEQVPGSATKQARISRPSSVRIGMFCRLGLFEDSRPVVAAVWLKVVCRRLSASTTSGSASR